MCDPISLSAATLALGGGSAVYEYGQGRANAKASAKYQRQVYESNKALADANALRAYSALQRRAAEEHAMASKSIQNVTDQATAAQAAARVASGESGTAGASVDAVYQDFARQEAEFAGTVIRQRLFNTRQLEMEAKGVQLGQQAQILSALPKPVETPSLIGALLRIGAAGLNAASTYTYLNQNNGS